MTATMKPKKSLAIRFKKLIKETATDLQTEIRLHLRSSEWVIEKDYKNHLKKTFGYKSDRELMIVIVACLKDFAISPISDYEVPIVGLEKETGNLLLGCNVEFPGGSLNLTIHAEQFLFTRAFQRGTSIKEFALHIPLPCGHCRQFIMEFHHAKNVVMTNSYGFHVAMKDLIPLSFGPENLRAPGIGKKSKGFQLRAEGDELTLAALQAANHSYAPYTETPSGVALKTVDGKIFTGSYIETAAFNPSLSPMHTAVIDLLSHSRSVGDISEATLVQSVKNVDQRAAAATLLQIMAPRVRLNTINI